jgi:hypothetical protein
MEGLWSLLVKNQSYLGKLKARAIYCAQAISSVEQDHHKLYGPFAGYWDDWLMPVEEMNAELKDSNSNTSEFLFELRDFIISLQAQKKLSRSDISYIKEVTSLAEGKLAEQEELLHSIDERIYLHKQLTEKLLLVEAIDNLSDE